MIFPFREAAPVVVIAPHRWFDWPFSWSPTQLRISWLDLDLKCVQMRAVIFSSSFWDKLICFWCTPGAVVIRVEERDTLIFGAIARWCLLHGVENVNYGFHLRWRDKLWGHCFSFQVYAGNLCGQKKLRVSGCGCWGDQKEGNWTRVAKVGAMVVKMMMVITKSSSWDQKKSY